MKWTAPRSLEEFTEAKEFALMLLRGGHSITWVSVYAEEHYATVYGWAKQAGLEAWKKRQASQEIIRGEVWRLVENFPDYEVSNFGRVRRVTDAGIYPAGYILATTTLLKGYPSVELRNAEGFVRHKVHRLVARAFLGPPPVGSQVDHIDGNKRNSRDTNLEYVTPSENARRAQRLGLRPSKRT